MEFMVNAAIFDSILQFSTAVDVARIFVPGALSFVDAYILLIEQIDAFQKL